MEATAIGGIRINDEMYQPTITTQLPTKEEGPRLNLDINVRFAVTAMASETPLTATILSNLSFHFKYSTRQLTKWDWVR